MVKEMMMMMMMMGTVLENPERLVRGIIEKWEVEQCDQIVECNRAGVLIFHSLIFAHCEGFKGNFFPFSYECIYHLLHHTAWTRLEFEQSQLIVISIYTASSPPWPQCRASHNPKGHASSNLSRNITTPTHHQ